MALDNFLKNRHPMSLYTSVTKEGQDNKSNCKNCNNCNSRDNDLALKSCILLNVK